MIFILLSFYDDRCVKEKIVSAERMSVFLQVNVLCVNLNICFLLQTPLSSFMQQEQWGGGYELYTLKMLGCSTIYNYRRRSRWEGTEWDFRPCLGCF